MKYVLKNYDDIKTKVDNMSVDELLSCIVCPIFVLPDAPSRKTTAVMYTSTEIENARKVSDTLNADRDEKALVVHDFEYGAGHVAIGAVQFPSMRAVAETGNEKLAYDMGIHTAGEARLAGYHWAFGPCVDILGNKRNPIVSIRTAGEDADTVIRYGGAYMKGMQDGGLIATLKHFPGDGYCDNDQHITTPVNPLSKEDWDESFGRVYRTLIEDGAMSIMPGHISLPCYDEIDPETGLYPPATVSYNLLTKLLRKQLGFEGIIVSDAVNMNGFCGYVGYYHASARFLEAGGDCLLFMNDNEEYHEKMKRELNLGTFSMETLKNRAYRMMCFSREYFEKNEENIAFDRKKAESCCEEIVKNSVSVVRDRINLLPLDKKQTKKVLHAIICNQGVSTPPKATTELTGLLTEMGIQVTEFIDPGCGNLLTSAKSGEYDLIICSVLAPALFGTNTIKLAGPIARNMMDGWMRYDTPTVFISYHDPYFGDDYYACVDTLINAYGYCEYTNKYIIERMYK